MNLRRKDLLHARGAGGLRIPCRRRVVGVGRALHVLFVLAGVGPRTRPGVTAGNFSACACRASTPAGRRQLMSGRPGKLRPSRRSGVQAGRDSRRRFRIFSALRVSRSGSTLKDTEVHVPQSSAFCRPDIRIVMRGHTPGQWVKTKSAPRLAGELVAGKGFASWSVRLNVAAIEQHRQGLGLGGGDCRVDGSAHQRPSHDASIAMTSTPHSSDVTIRCFRSMAFAVERFSVRYW